MTAPVATNPNSGSLATMQDNAVDTAVMGALEGLDDPNEGPAMDEAGEVSTPEKAVDKAADAEAAAEGRTKLKIKEIPEEAEEPKPTLKRNDDGTFAKQKEKADAKATEPAKAEKAEEGHEEVLARLDKRLDSLNEQRPEAKREPVKLAIDFKAYGENDEELDPQEVVQKIKAIEIPWKDGTRKFRLDALGRLAQAGIVLQERDESAREAIAKFQAVQDELGEMQDRIKRQNDFVEKLLADDEFRAHYRAQWEAHNTPEARAERAERRAKELEEQMSGQAKAQSASSFFKDDVLAPIQSLRQQYPTVTEAELEAQLNALTANLGKEIQPKDYPTVRTLVRDVLPAIAASIHESRQSREEGETKLRQVRESNTLLKKQIAQGARPIGRVATAGEAKAPRKEPRTMDERIESIIDSEIEVGF